jgi:proteic killer suppression protein
VEITFKDKKLRKAAVSLKLLIQVYGKRRGELLKVRLDDLLTAETLEDVRYLPGHYHELTQDRKG